MTSIATLGRSGGLQSSQEDLKAQTLAAKLTGELSTHEMLEESKETQENIAAVLDVFGVNGGNERKGNNGTENEFFSFNL